MRILKNGPPNKPPKWVGCHLGFMKGPRPQSPAGRQRQRERRSAESWNNLRAPGSSEFELGDGAWKNKSWTEWLDHFFLAIYFWLWILGQGFRRKKVGWVATSLNVQAIVQRLRTEVKGSGCVLQETNRETMGLPILQLGKAWTGWTFSQGLVSYLGQSKAERPCRRRSHRWRLRCIWRQLLLNHLPLPNIRLNIFYPPKNHQARIGRRENSQETIMFGGVFYCRFLWIPWNQAGHSANSPPEMRMSGPWGYRGNRPADWLVAISYGSKSIKIKKVWGWSPPFIWTIL